MRREPRHAGQRASEREAAASDDFAAWTFARHREVIAALPERVDGSDVLAESLLLHREPAFAVHYAPFEWVEPTARLVLLGLAPGRFQARNALQAARDALHAGLPDEEVLHLARLAGSFSGPIRARLVLALDQVGVGPRLGVPDAAHLFGAGRPSVHLTAAVRFPVFVGTRNWTGSAPPLRRAPVLQEVVRRFLAAELAAVPDALVLPLGQGATEATRLLVAEDALAEQRVVAGLPHPSPANGHFAPLLRANARAVRARLARCLP